MLYAEGPAADLLNVSVRTLQAWRVRGGGPRFVKLGRAVRYTLADLESFVYSQLRAHTSATTPSADAFQVSLITHTRTRPEGPFSGTIRAIQNDFEQNQLSNKERLYGERIAAQSLRENVGIYFLWHGDDIVYIGRSQSILSRLMQHMHDGKIFDAYSYISCELHEIAAKERYFIDLFMPRLNRDTATLRRLRLSA
jgi:hypothetical protein